MSILGIIYGSAGLLALLLSLTMEFRHRRERYAVVLIAALMVAAMLMTQIIRPVPSADDLSIFVVIDFAIAAIAFMLFLNRPLPWCMTMVGVSLCSLGLDMFWPIYVEGSWAFRNTWAWVSNGLFVIQLGCIIYASLEFSCRRMWIKKQRRKNPLYGTVWDNKGMRLYDEDKDRL